MLLVDDDDELAGSPTDRELALAGSLAVAGLRRVDDAIVDAAQARWLKVARVAFDAIKAGGFSTDDETVVQLHVRRIAALVEVGALEGQGGLHRPRFSEVRLPTAGR
jgi:hypothetical protein